MRQFSPASCFLKISAGCLFHLIKILTSGPLVMSTVKLPAFVYYFLLRDNRCSYQSSAELKGYTKVLNSEVLGREGASTVDF